MKSFLLGNVLRMLFLAWGMLCVAGAFGAGARPNIVLIYTDDHDLDEIGCYAGPMPTPHMDGLARDGAQDWIRRLGAPGACANRNARHHAQRPPTRQDFVCGRTRRFGRRAHALWVRDRA